MEYLWFNTIELSRNCFKIFLPQFSIFIIGKPWEVAFLLHSRKLCVSLLNQKGF